MRAIICAYFYSRCAYKNIDTRKMLYFSAVWLEKYWYLIACSFLKRKRSYKKRHFACSIQYAKIEKSNSRACEVILHPTEKHARVNPSPSSTYRVVHIHRSTWHDERASGAPVVPARSWHVAGHVAVLTSGLFIPTSLVHRCTRIAFPLGLLPIFVGCPLIGKNRLDGFAADFTACSNDLWR